MRTLEDAVITGFLLGVVTTIAIRWAYRRITNRNAKIFAVDFDELTNRNRR